MSHSIPQHMASEEVPSDSDASSAFMDVLTQSPAKLEFTDGSTTLSKNALMRFSLSEPANSTHVTTSSTERFFRIPELRLKLYETICEAVRMTTPGNLTAYSGFLTISSVTYKESSFELLNIRTMYLTSEEQRWKHTLQRALHVPAPTTLQQLQEVTVLLPASFFSDNHQSTVPQNLWPTPSDWHVPIEGATGKAFVEFPLGKLDVDRQTFSIYADVADAQV
ncbi:hypothetical protein G6011_03440 [Alternaria panax]|uniref:Uncharacterized protein n=1 Tax=Alternaria panax TaxID=48097 RepID=A0AAD4NU15_9PLEO|nr:hypothetical protein G6011_03440 [Alternaria panax]